MAQNSVRVTVTGAAGQIGYALLFRIASGQMFGTETSVHLNLLELKQALDALEGVRMELDDCAFPLLKSVTTTAEADVAFSEADWALLIGAVPRKKGMERGDLLAINAEIFSAQGTSISKSARPTCKVLVVGNPCNTNALIARNAAQNLPATSFFAMTMLDQNRAVTQLAAKAGREVTAVQNLTVWGNHSPTMYPDFYNATIDGQPLLQVIRDESWLQGAFLKTVQQRGSAIIKARGLSSAASAANAVVDTVQALTTPTPAGQRFSACVPSDGSYGVPEGLVFSFPLRCDGSGYQIVQGIEHHEFAKKKLEATVRELEEEREAVENLV